MRQTLTLKFVFLIFLFCSGLSSLTGQVEFKLQLMNDTTWGVFATHNSTGGSPTDNVTLGSGQATIVAPTGFVWSGFVSVNGIWQQNARVNAPVENPTHDYIDVGYNSSFPADALTDTAETLLFTFEKVGDCPDTLFLMDRRIDAFAPPNSAGNNPGQDFFAIDIGNGSVYNWSDNYAFSAWNCGDCDGDGILDAIEDSNGDGNYDPISEDLNGNGIFDLPGEDLDLDGNFDIEPDLSGICDPCDPIHPELAEIRGDTTMCASEDNTDIFVDITGGWPPYQVVYENDAGDRDTVSDYESGDPINLTLLATDTFELVQITDSTGCTVDSMAGQAVITIEGPLAITSDPVAVVECYGNPTSFTSPATNGGASTIQYNWQISSAPASGFTDLTNGTPYTGVDTDNLLISDVAGLNAMYYRLAIFTDYCDTVYSVSALLTVEGPIVVDVEPRDTAICADQTATFTSSASAALGVVTGQWQLSADNGTTWNNVSGGDFAGGTTATLTVSNATNYYDYLFRRQYTTPVCAIVNSAEALLTVEGPISIVDQPDDINECSAQGLEFVVGVTNTSTSANPGTIEYQWQVSYDTTVTWVDLTNDASYNGVRSDTLSVDLSDSLNGTWYRVLVWTSECAVAISDSAELSVSDQAAFDLEPQDITLCDGMDTIFTANATVAQGAFTYHWQVSKDTGATWVDIDVDGGAAEGVTYGSGTNDTLTMSGVSYLQNGFQYRVEARTDDCVPAPSAAATLTVEGPISITTSPANDTVCRNEQATFSILMANPGGGIIDYQWQLNTGSGWTDIPNVPNHPVYGGAITSNLTISTDQGGNDGDSLRVIMSTSTCASVTSVGVRMTIEGPLSIIDQPEDTTVCSGNAAAFYADYANANDGVVELRWEFSDDTINYTEIADLTAGYSGQDSRVLSIADVSGMYDRRFRFKVRTGDCDWFYSEYATLTVEGPYSIDVGGQPQDVSLCEEGNAIFWVNVTNASTSADPGIIEYQWEIKERGSGVWTNLASDPDSIGTTTADTLSIAPASAFRNGDSVRVKIWTATCEADALLISEAAGLTVEGPVVIDTEPSPDTICAGGTANFDMAYSIPNGGAGTATLQWQVSTDNGVTWSDISNSAPYSGVTTTDLTITAPDSSYNDNRYRVAYQLATCTVDYTDDAVLTVEGPIRFTAQPIDVVSCDAQDELFYVSIANGGGGTVDFQWQVSTDNGTSWSDVSSGGPEGYTGVTSDVLAIGQIMASMDGNLYRVNMNTGDCSQATSEFGTLTVEGPLAFTNHPDDITVCSGNDTIMVVEMTNLGNGGVADIDIQWIFSSNNGASWNNVPDNADFDDVTNDTLVINDVAGYDQYQFRAQISTGTCPITESEPAILTVEGPISATDPTSITDCNENSIRFTSVVTNPGAGVVNYQWETLDGGSWVTMANDTSAAGQFNGVRTDTLSISDVNADSLNGSQYRLRIWTSTCMEVYTNPATLTIEGPLTIEDSPNDTIVCSGMPAEFYMEVDAGQGGSVTYQWQVSTDGTTYSDLTNTGVYTTTDTRILNISDVAGLYGRYYRCAVNTTYCDVKYTDPARLTVEGPLTITNQPDSLIACRNEAYFFQTEVLNGGSGVMSYQWEVLDVNAGTWSDESDDTWVHGSNTTLLQLDSMDLMQTNGDTVFRLRIDLPTCNSFYSDVVLLHIVSDTLGFCDFDMDGLINDIDEDDDDDGLDDIWEYSCMNYGQFNQDVDNDGDFDGEEDWDGDQISNHEETDGDLVLDGDPCDPCDPLVSSNCFGISLDVKALLYGAAYNGLTGALGTVMGDDLRQADTLLPSTEPYTEIDYSSAGNDVSPFGHQGPGGGEYILDPATVFADKGDSSVVDWVFIELRHANKIDSVIATRAALITKEGDVVDVDGTSNVTFNNTVVAGEYYVALRHRNHMGVMTVDAPELSPILRTVDFRDTSVTFHGDHPMVQKNGRNYLWGGDLRPDGRVIYQGPNNDITQIFLKVISDPENTTGPGGTPNANHILSGYLEEDFDMNGTAIFQGPGNDRIMVLGQTVIAHPGNENILANYIVVEQLP